MPMKDPRELSVLKHVIAWGVGLPAVCVLAVTAAGIAVDSSGTQILGFSFLFGSLALATGWIVGLIAYVLNRGIHGWAQVGRDFREARREEEAAFAADARLRADAALAAHQGRYAPAAPQPTYPSTQDAAPMTPEPPTTAPLTPRAPEPPPKLSVYI